MSPYKFSKNYNKALELILQGVVLIYVYYNPANSDYCGFVSGYTPVWDKDKKLDYCKLRKPNEFTIADKSYHDAGLVGNDPETIARNRKRSFIDHCTKCYVEFLFNEY